MIKKLKNTYKELFQIFWECRYHIVVGVSLAMAILLMCIGLVFLLNAIFD